jgi:hypothetical protein
MQLMEQHRSYLSDRGGEDRRNARHRQFFAAFLVLLLAGPAVSPVVSAALKEFSVEELTRHAEVVVIGKIVSVTSSWNRERTQIFTRVDLEPEEVLKGVPSRDRISFVQPGGRVGNVGSVVPETPSFSDGERVVLFLTPRRDGQLVVIALFQGKFNIEGDPTTNLDMAVRHAPGSGQILDQMTLDVLRSQILAAIGK